MFGQQERNNTAQLVNMCTYNGNSIRHLSGLWDWRRSKALAPNLSCEICHFLCNFSITFKRWPAAKSCQLHPKAMASQSHVPLKARTDLFIFFPLAPRRTDKIWKTSPKSKTKTMGEIIRQHQEGSSHLAFGSLWKSLANKIIFNFL